MITTTNDRSNYIGGSEANMIYMNYHTKTFVDWWSKKLSGTPENSFSNKFMDVGTILEHDIIDLYEEREGVKGVREASEVKGIARANTDYIIGKKVSDIKATGKAFEWFIKEIVPKNYVRQLTHYMYVFGLKEASIIAYQVDDSVLADPFSELCPNKLFEIPVIVTDEDIKEHRQRIEYLEHCKDMSIFPKG